MMHGQKNLKLYNTVDSSKITSQN